MRCFAKFIKGITLATLVLVLAVPQMAFAAEADTGAGNSGEVPIAPDESVASGGGNRDDVIVSSEIDAAVIEGKSFALDFFNRAQVGSNRTIDGTYYGYSFFMGDSSDQVVLVGTENDVVVYVPASASSVGFSFSNSADIDALKSYLIALDTANAQGGAVVSAEMQWHFTQSSSYEVAGVTFRFAAELRNDQFYTSIIGSDGSDVTDSNNPNYTRITHASFATFVAAEDANIAIAKTGWDAFVDFLGTVDYSPLWVTLRTTGVAIIFIVICGLAAAYFSLRIPARAQDIVDSIFTIPMVLPPTVCGFILLMLLGRNSPVGQWFIDIGFPLIFSWPATVIAAIVVAFPLMYRSARGAFEGLDANMLDAARTLGWSNKRIFFKLMLPLSWSSIAAGAVLSFARALGEFGATLFVAGNFLGITRTIPIAIYFEWMNGQFEVALFWTVIIIIFSFIVILFINLMGRRTTKYRRSIKE